jgi:hypothetical protein
VLWALAWFALFVVLVLAFAGLGSFTCYLDPEATGCSRQPMINTACIVMAAMWLILFVANLTLPVFRYGPNARRRAWLWGPPLLILGLILVVKPL